MESFGFEGDFNCLERVESSVGFVPSQSHELALVAGREEPTHSLHQLQRSWNDSPVLLDERV